MHLGHAAYVVKDLQKTLDFYCGGLGFTKMFTRMNEDGTPGMTYVKVNDREFLEFFPKRTLPHSANENGSAAPPAAHDAEPHVSYQHLCLHTDDIEKELAGLKSRGVMPEGEISKGKAGSLQIWLKDPDGNKIELMQLLPDSLHLKA